MAPIAKHDWTPVSSVHILSKGGKACGGCAAERMLVNTQEEFSDRRFWSAFDHFQVEREARAMRNAHVAAMGARMGAMLRELWQRAAKRLSTGFAHGDAQPRRENRTRASP